MASNYPTSLDNFTNPTSNDSLNSPSHSLQHANINDAVEAIEAKLGIGASPAGSAVSGYVLTAGTGGTTTWSPITPSGLVLLNTTSITTSVSQVIVNNVFSANYDVYKIYFNYITDLGNSQRNNLFRLRVSGSDDTGNNYSNISSAYENINFRTGGQNSTTSGWVITSTYYDGTYNFGEITLNQPFQAGRTYATWQSRGGESAVDTTITGTGMHTLSTSYTGFTFNLANMELGKIYVYGMRNS